MQCHPLLVGDTPQARGQSRAAAGGYRHPTRFPGPRRLPFDLMTSRRYRNTGPGSDPAVNYSTHHGLVVHHK